MLLEETDHRALADACRDVLARRKEFGNEPDPQDPRLPESIGRLRATRIDLTKHYVAIELHGGFDHYGVLFYTEGADVTDGSRELAPRLWYYSEG